MTRRSLVLRPVAVLTTLACLLAAGACRSSNPKLPAPGSVEADKYLFDRGTDALNRKRWLTAREYFKKLVDTYPQSTHRQDAKLGIGDSFIGENSVETNILAANEFREFLTYYPLNPKADYAQYRIGLANFRQMYDAERDQTATFQALKEFEKFLQAYPNSSYRPEVEKLQRQAKDRLSEHDYKVGVYYFRVKWYPGAIDRFKTLLARDPEYSRRDAVYFYLAESLHMAKVDAEALPYYDRLVTEFLKSDYLQKAKRRVAELKR